MPVVDIDGELVLAAVSLNRSAQVSLWDAAIIAAAQRAGCERLYSEDLNAGQVFGRVTVVDPFAATARPAESSLGDREAPE